MKKPWLVSAALATLALFGCYRHDESYSALWGVWNLGPQKAALFNYHRDDQLYARTPDFLSFEKGPKIPTTRPKHQAEAETSREDFEGTLPVFANSFSTSC